MKINNDLATKIFNDRFNELLELKSNFFKIIVKKIYDECDFKLKVKIMFNNVDFKYVILNDFIFFINNKIYIIDSYHENYIQILFQEYHELLKNHINEKINEEWYKNQKKIIFDFINSK